MLGIALLRRSIDLANSITLAIGALIVSFYTANFITLAECSGAREEEGEGGARRTGSFLCLRLGVRREGGKREGGEGEGGGRKGGREEGRKGGRERTVGTL
jgi:hypothetical protein